MIKKKTSNENKLIFYFLCSFFIIVLISVTVCLADSSLGLSEKIFDDLDEGRALAVDFFLVEVQMAFITLSMSTALTTSSKHVYWEETYTYRLISPVITNFTALSAYTLATLVDGLIWCIVDRITAYRGILSVFLSFLLAVFFLILLTARMIDANFGRERMKADLEKKLIKKRDSLPAAYNITMDKGRLIPEVNKLMQVTFQELDEKELDLVCENMLLLSRMGFGKELKILYDHARNVIDSDIVMQEIDHRLVRDVIHGNNIDFFYSVNGCPIPERKQYQLWELCIHDIFDEAVSLWKKKKNRAAMQKRRDLFILLTRYLYYKVIWAEEDEDYYDIIYLMGVFSVRRQNVWYGTPCDKGLDEKWERPEWWDIDEKTFEDDTDDDQGENALEGLYQKTGKVLKRWKEKGYPDFVGEYEEYYLHEAEKFYSGREKK